MCIRVLVVLESTHYSLQSASALRLSACSAATMINQSIIMLYLFSAVSSVCDPRVNHCCDGKKDRRGEENRRGGSILHCFSRLCLVIHSLNQSINQSWYVSANRLYPHTFGSYCSINGVTSSPCLTLLLKCETHPCIPLSSTTTLGRVVLLVIEGVTVDVVEFVVLMDADGGGGGGKGVGIGRGPEVMVDGVVGVVVVVVFARDCLTNDTNCCAAAGPLCCDNIQ
jgi:hypothetical protein